MGLREMLASFPHNSAETADMLKYRISVELLYAYRTPVAPGPIR